jgi:amino acid transporter
MTNDATNAQPELMGNLGLFHLFFTVMAWNAPLVIVFAAIPIVVGYGNGIGAAGAFIVAGVTIGLFALGFTRMTKILPTPGAFYAYITAGLGKKLGLGSGLLTLVGYFAAYSGTIAFGGVVSNQLFHDTLGLPDTALVPVGRYHMGRCGHTRPPKVLTFGDPPQRVPRA